MEIEQAQQFVTSGIEATGFKLVRSPDEIEDSDGYFKPDMCHQIFGETESIFGYKNLKINLLFDANTFRCYVNHTYDSLVGSGLEPEDFMEKLNPWLPNNYLTDKNEFKRHISSQRNKLEPFGELVHSVHPADGPKKGCHFEIYTCNKTDSGYANFHQRMETLIVWYIDAANFIDITDNKWLFFVIYEKVRRQSSVIYYPVGYSSVYEYYAYPEHRRYRISQFIIFPPFQNTGLGTELLKTIYFRLRGFENIYDITVEDPSEKFQLMRDFVDIRHCKTLRSFGRTHVKGSFSKDMIEEARYCYKLNEKQSRRVYEILRLSYTNVDDANEYNAYKVMIKTRLNAPFKRQENKKFTKLFKGASYLHYDHRLKLIEKDFENLVKQYRHVISRLQKQ